MPRQKPLSGPVEKSAPHFSSGTATGADRPATKKYFEKMLATACLAVFFLLVEVV
jgi:hypothetical protein